MADAQRVEIGFECGDARGQSRIGLRRPRRGCRLFGLAEPCIKIGELAHLLFGSGNATGKFRDRTRIGRRIGLIPFRLHLAARGNHEHHHREEPCSHPPSMPAARCRWLVDGDHRTPAAIAIARTASIVSASAAVLSSR